MRESHLQQLLLENIRQKQFPDGSNYLALHDSEELLIHEKSGLSRKAIQIAALQSGIIPERYCRNQNSLSTGDQIRLLQSTVAIIGLGGLGGCVCEILARLGIGSLILVDGDVFEDSNLNRQLLSSTGNIGKQKCMAAKERVMAINPAIECDVKPHFLTPENCHDILHQAHLAVDCLDSIQTRFLLEKGCQKERIPLVSAAIAGTSGQATVVFPGDRGFRKIYGSPEAAPEKGLEKRLGTLPYAAVFMAAIECAEVVSILCTQSSNLHNRLLFANIKEHYIEKVDFGKEK